MYVQDAGRPDWSCESRVELRLGDVNDNRPMWEQEGFLASLPEDAEVGSIVTKVHAIDLDLGENRISQLREGDFDGLKELHGLRVSGNALTEIGKGLFANSSNLHVLNLARNRLAKVEQGSFDGLVELRALRLDNNALADINGLVSSLEKLKWLNVSSNRLQWFDYAFVPRSLEWLDVHGNQIEELGNYYKLEGEFRDDT